MSVPASPLPVFHALLPALRSLRSLSRFFPPAVPSRNSLWLALVGIPLERAVRFHRWLSHAAVVLTVVHLVLMTGLRGAGVLFEAHETAIGGGTVYGTASALLMFVMFVTAVEFVRRGMFEVFYYTHRVLWPAVVALAMVHSSLFLRLAIVPAACMVIDWVARWLYSRDAKVRREAGF